MKNNYLKIDIGRRIFQYLSYSQKDVFLNLLQEDNHAEIEIAKWNALMDTNEGCELGANGLGIIHGHYSVWYIDIAKLIKYGAELDLKFKPSPYFFPHLCKCVG